MLRLGRSRSVVRAVNPTGPCHEGTTRAKLANLSIREIVGATNSCGPFRPTNPADTGPSVAGRVLARPDGTMIRRYCPLWDDEFEYRLLDLALTFSVGTPFGHLFEVLGDFLLVTIR